MEPVPCTSGRMAVILTLTTIDFSRSNARSSRPCLSGSLKG
jgi:hypothetical protein